MSSVARKLLQVQPSAADDTGDDDFANVVLLLDGDGTSGDDNNTFTNSGNTVTTIGTTGDVIQGSFSPYGNNWSVYFDGSSYLDTASGATALGTGAFTVEFWINTTDTSFNIMNPDSSTGNGFWGLMVQSGDLRWNNQYNLTNLWVVDGAPILDGEWHHVAIVSSSSVFKVFYDGVSQSIQSGSFTDSYNYPYSDGLRIGKGNLDNFTGYLSNIRLVSGTAIYSSDFDVPTAPFTNSTSYTEKLLACQSNRFIDNGNSSYAITVSGSPKVTPFSPFKDSDARDITTDGGSAYFAGSGDHVDITDHNDLDFGTGDFTFEFWAYVLEGTVSNDGLISKGNTGTGWQIIYTAGEKLKFIRTSGNSSSPQITSSADAAAYNQWHHIAVTRSGTTVTLWINGVSEGTYTDSTSWDTSEPLRLATNRGENNDYVGYISDFRLFKGFVKYTAAFDPPTEPLGGIVGSAYTLNNVEYENKSFDAGSQDGSPFGVDFNSDGTKMYVAGSVTDTIYQYVLTTAFDVSTASYDNKSFSVTSEDTTPQSVRFKTDGSKMYVIGSTNDSVYQYSLSTSYDVSTASYDSVSFSVTSQATGPQGLTFSSDGTKMYVVGSSSDTIYQYTLSTAWDISTASYDSKSLSVSSQEAAPSEVLLNNDGTKIFIVGYSSDRIRQYSMTTAYDLSTASFDDLSYFVRSEESNPRGLAFNSDGSKIYIIGTTNDTVYQYSLTNTKTPEVVLNFQDAGIYDLAGINNVDTVGNAQIDTAVKKYGTGSIEFDETGDYLKVPSTDDIALGTGDFTIEGWLYIGTNPVGNGQGMFQISNGHLNSAVRGPAVGLNNGDGKWAIYYGTSQQTATAAAPSINTWYHVAYVRYSSTTKLYIDGTELISVSDSTDYSDTYLAIGGWYSISYLLNGFIDDFRITKGIARYTANFTPPTAALPKF